MGTNTFIGKRYLNKIEAIMSSTSQKHREFCGEPMGDKLVTEIAGIGPTIGGRLKQKGFDYAYVLLGQFLVFKKDEELFTDWFKEETGANKKYSKDAYECLNEWCNSFL